MDSDEFDDLVAAAESSIDFWDNRYDDEDWNDAAPGRIENVQDVL